MNLKRGELTLSLRLSMALSIHPTVPSPPAARTRNVMCGSRWHHSRPSSGRISARSITFKYKIITIIAWFDTFTTEEHLSVTLNICNTF